MTKMGQNRVLIYYPTEKDQKEFYPDYKWAMDGDKMLKGLYRFAAKLVPMGPFYSLTNLRLGIKVKAPLIKFGKKDKHGSKFVPIIFSHGVGNTTTWFSCILKDLAS